MHNATAGRLSATFEDLGRLALKNIERPVQAYAVRWARGLPCRRREDLVALVHPLHIVGRPD